MNHYIKYKKEKLIWIFKNMNIKNKKNSIVMAVGF